MISENIFKFVKVMLQILQTFVVMVCICIGRSVCNYRCWRVYVSATNSVITFHRYTD